jgi:hypothetical protein
MLKPILAGRRDMNRRLPAWLIGELVAATLWAAHGRAATIDAAFSASFTVTDLGPGPATTPHGGVSFLPGDPNHILLGGNANAVTGFFNKIALSRDANCHVDGFVIPPTAYGTVGEYNDGGVTFGPGHVLFSTRYPRNELAQTRISSSDEDRVDDLDLHGVVTTVSVSGAAFVPGGFAGAGQLKLTEINGNWYTMPLAADGAGTFTPGTAVFHANLTGGTESFAYVSGSNAVFGADSIVIAESNLGVLATYAIDGNGNPVVASRRRFAFGFGATVGVAVDPLTGDLLVSDLSLSSIFRISGFVVPQVPEQIFTDGFDDLCAGAG